MADTTLERVVVELDGDASGYEQMIQDAMRQAQMMADDLIGAHRRAEVGASAAMEGMGLSASQAASMMGAAWQQAGQSVYAMGQQAGGAFSQVIANAKDMAQQVGTAMKTAAQNVAALGSSLQKLASYAVAGLSGLGFATTLGGAFANFSSYEVLTTRLSAAIESNGRMAAGVVPGYQAFAAEIGKTTTTMKLTTLSLLAEAEAMGVSGEAAKQAVKNAIALAAATGGDPRSSMHQAVRLAFGETQRLDRVIPGLHGITDESERAAYAQEKLTKMFGQAQAMGQTSAANLERLKISLAGLSTEVGGLVAGYLNPLLSGVKDAVGWFQSLDESSRKTAAGVAAAGMGFIALGQVLPILKNAVVEAKNLAQNILSNPVTLWTAAIGIGAVAAGALALRISGVSAELAGMNAELAKSAELNKQIAEREQKKGQATLDKAAEITDPGERKAFIGKELETAKKQVEEYVKALEAAKKRAADMNILESGGTTVLANLPDFVDYFLGVKAGAQAVNSEVTDFASRLKAAQGVATALEEALGKLSGSLADQKLARDVQQLTDKLQEEIDQVGMSAAEIEIYKLALRGASDEQLKWARLMADVKEMAEDQHKVSEEAKKLGETLQTQVSTFGLSSHAAEIWKLSLDGATKAELANARAAAAQLAVKEEQKKMMEDAAQVILDVQTPQEKLGERLVFLEDLLADGAIGWETYARAVDKARSELEDAKGAANSFSAAAVGSAEAASRIAAYTDMVRMKNVGTEAEAVARSKERRGIKDEIGGEGQGVVVGGADISAAVDSLVKPLENLADLVKQWLEEAKGGGGPEYMDVGGGGGGTEYEAGVRPAEGAPVEYEAGLRPGTPVEYEAGIQPVGAGGQLFPPEALSLFQQMLEMLQRLVEKEPLVLEEFNP